MKTNKEEKYCLKYIFPINILFLQIYIQNVASNQFLKSEQRNIQKKKRLLRLPKMFPNKWSIEFRYETFSNIFRATIQCKCQHM
jgi:hypothetical protein